jgi:hypothetical protein
VKAARRIELDRLGPVQWPTDRAADWALRLTENANVKAVVAIGSAARGRAGPSSDVDLIVVCRDARDKVPAPPEVDARWVDTAELGTSVGKGDDVFAWGVAFGVPLFDPDKTWHRLVAEWRDRLPLPGQEVCKQRAARARRYVVDLIESGDDEAAAEQALTMLTHEARLALCTRGVFPASRPELVDQLKSIGAAGLAELLSRAIERALDPRDALEFCDKFARQGQAPQAPSGRE